ncbi:MAG: response regulator [Hyphomonadaceae bacterium]
MTKLRKVLIVDDNPRCGELLSLAFEACGCVEVETEAKSRNALERVQASRPDIIMLDIKMPELDGFDVLSAIRGTGDSVPVIMCSGSALQNDVRRAYASGCNGYLEKPASLEGYRNMVSAICQYWTMNKLPDGM